MAPRLSVRWEFAPRDAPRVSDGGVGRAGQDRSLDHLAEQRPVFYRGQVGSPVVLRVNAMLCTRSQQREFGCIDAVQLGTSIIHNEDGVWPMRVDFGLVVELLFTLDEVGHTPSITVVLLRKNSFDDSFILIPIYTSDMPGGPVSAITKLVAIDYVVEDEVLARLAGGKAYISFPFDDQVLPAAGVYVIGTRVNDELGGRTAFRAI